MKDIGLLKKMEKKRISDDKFSRKVIIKNDDDEKSDDDFEIGNKSIFLNYYLSSCLIDIEDV